MILACCMEYLANGVVCCYVKLWSHFSRVLLLFAVMYNYIKIHIDLSVGAAVLQISYLKTFYP